MEYPIDLPGGGQESTKTLCEGLADTPDYEPVVACPTLLSSKPSDYPFTVVTYESDENREQSKVRRIGNFLSRIKSFKRIIKSVRPDLIHVSMSESLITYGFVRTTGRFGDIPFIYTDRGLCYGYRMHSMACIKATMKHAKRMLTTTKYNASLWKDRISVPVTVIPNTISTAFADYDPAVRKRMRDKFGIKDDETVIGFAGRISEEKDWERVPDLVGVLASSKLSFKVALVMSVYEQRDADIVKSVRDGIISHIGEDNLIYMQDLDQKEISDYYYLVDFFMMTSKFESFGKAAVEAMSRKCIVLSTAVGGLPEVIGNEKNLYDINDAAKAAGRIEYLLSHPDEAEAERQRGYMRYKENFTVEKNIEGHIKVYEEILGVTDERRKQ